MKRFRVAGMAAERVGVQIGLHGVLAAARAEHVLTGLLPGFQIEQPFGNPITVRHRCIPPRCALAFPYRAVPVAAQRIFPCVGPYHHLF